MLSCIHHYSVIICGERKAVPKDVPVLIPRTCEYVLLHGKRKWRLQVELRLLISWSGNWEIILGYLAGFNLKDLYVAEEAESVREEGDKDLPCSCWLEEGTWIKEYGQPSEARKCKEKYFSLEPPEGTQSCWHLDFSPVRPISDRQEKTNSIMKMGSIIN